MPKTTAHIISTDIYTYSDILVHDIVHIVAGYMHAPETDIYDRIWSTYIFARDAHTGQIRKSGEPYITHPLEAVKLLLILKPDIISIQACILHDVIEDTPVSVDDIREKFGPEVADICEWLTKLSGIRYYGEERTIESLRKMLLATVTDLRVIMVKLADRLHNMQTLDAHPDPAKREKIATETLNIYAPIADRLGIFQFKEMLETECMRILLPTEYAQIVSDMSDLHTEREFFITHLTEQLTEVFGSTVPILEVSARVKAPYSIYKKLQRKEYAYTHAGDLYDLFAVRIITESIPHCYEILGILHNVFTPMPQRFKDYIALPKENGYKSLHTTVVGIFSEKRKQPTEIQIRTRAMHVQAELGVAAHFAYSEKWKSVITKDIHWVKMIHDILGKSPEGAEFMNEMKVNIFEDQIFVFTPKWSIITLPKGATPVDFAYAIHSDVWNRMTIAKVNGHVVPLDYILRNGESVSIVTDPHKKPNPAWLSFVKTARAKEVLRSQINKDQREYLIDKWRQILHEYIEKNYEKWLDKELSILKNIDGHIQDTKGKEDILVQIGNLSRKPSALMHAVDASIIREKLWSRKIEEVGTKKRPRKESQIEEIVHILIWGEKNIPYKMAKCCAPTQGDKIIAYSGMGDMTIHQHDCINIPKIDLDRRIPAHWSHIPPDGETICIEIVLRDRRGILRQLTDIFYQMGLSIEDMHAQKKDGIHVCDTFTLYTPDEDYYVYERIVERIQTVIPEYVSARKIPI